jgi:hypothetical protein
LPAAQVVQRVKAVEGKGCVLGSERGWTAEAGLQRSV